MSSLFLSSHFYLAREVFHAIGWLDCIDISGFDKCIKKTVELKIHCSSSAKRKQEKRKEKKRKENAKKKIIKIKIWQRYYVRCAGHWRFVFTYIHI